MNASSSKTPSPWDDDRFHRLAQRAAEGTLDGAEASEFQDRLRSSEAARELYVQYCQLHAAFEHEDDLKLLLAAASQPANVVSLPGTKPLIASQDAAEAAEGQALGSVEADSVAPLPSGSPDRARGWLNLLAAAAAVGAAALILALWQERGGGRDEVGAAGTGGSLAGLPEAGSGADSDPGSVVPGSPNRAVEPIAVEEEGLENSSQKESNSLMVKPGEDLSPLEQYASSPVMANVSPGSQSRPPNPVVTVGAKSRISFNRDIRPILSDNCFHCHGPDEEGRKADLRLDLRQTAISSDSNEAGPIVPGDLASSQFFARIISEDPDDLMPPPDSHKRLTPAQVDLFRQWILEGAEWEEHWAFVPISDAPAPEIESDWIQNDIDRFVLARLNAEGLAPSELADRRTLIRRTTFDLLGLPPSPEAIEAFVNDTSPEAFETLVDRLLESPAYGEHRARYWLDAARYADTHGLHLDNYREMWPYRDWVIRAYNENLPFDQFTIEQIAGDLLPSPSQEQLVATGFNRCNVTTSEGGAIAEEFLVRYAIDRVSTTATVWMGLTAGCAQCHNHKYDPISMREFYELFAYFNNTTQPGMDGNAKDSPPVIRVFEDEAEKQRVEELRKKLAKHTEETLKPLAQAATADFEAWSNDGKAGDSLSKARLPGSLVETPAESKDGKAVSLGNLGQFRKAEPFTISLHFKAPAEDGRAVLLSKTDPEEQDRGWRLVWEDQSINLELIGAWPNETLRSGITRRVKAGSAGNFVVTYDGSGTSEGIRFFYRGQAQSSRFVKEWFDTLEGDFDTAAPLRLGGTDPGSGLAAEVSEVRLFDRKLTPAELKFLNDRSRLIGVARKPAEKRSDKEKGELKQAWLLALSEPYREGLVRQGILETEISRLESRRPITLVMNEKADSEPMAHVLERGEYDHKTEQVGVGVPDFLPPLPEGAPGNRLGLAQWLVSRQHPLTARVMVNRAWQELFGVGLVKTAEDFGTQGEPPSHPELLDWLATEFMESGWDIKGLYRTILLSSTYQQSARTTPEMAARDPENRLLARGPRFRLDAEMIRDQALAASGLLDPTIGGESVRPWQPGGIWEAVGYTNSNTQTFYADYGSKAEHRRSVYTFWKRTAPPPNLNVFDAPNRESCTVRRERTNTPLQALVLMNDPQFLRATRHLALQALNAHDRVDDRIDYLSLRLTGRPMDGEEKRMLKASLAQFQNAWGSEPESARAFLADETNQRFSLDEEKAPVELASWAMVASQIMNLDESISKP